MKKTAFAVASLLVFLVNADVKMPAIFSDNMVLQRGKTANIWGWANPGETVTVKGNWNHEAVAVATPESGKWQLRLPLPPAGGPFQLKINGNNRIVYKNVMVGEVWICSGQSNMEWGIGRFADAKTDKNKANHPNIRLFMINRNLSSIPKETLDNGERWKVCNPFTITEGGNGGFSATAFYFARYLEKQLGVPVGVIQTAWGGTPAEAWTAEATLKQIGGYDDLLTDLGKMKMPQAKLKQLNLDRMYKWKKDIEKVDTGLGEKWFEKTFVPQNWKQMQSPGNWENEVQELTAFDGIIWFKKAVIIPEDWKGKSLILELGTVDDEDTTWFNGVKVGEEHSWNIYRRYTIPGGRVQPGEASITVRVSDTGGSGGFTGSTENMVIYPAGDKEAGIPLAGTWEYKATTPKEKLPEPPQLMRLHPHMGSVLFNGMINPLLPLSFKGVVWYQGESNAQQAYRYEELFRSMISSWRQHFNNDNFPFYYVQIAPFCYDHPGKNAIGIQEAQRRTMSLENTGMAVTNDIGNIYNIHPGNKYQVGKRLALWALAKAYGKRIFYSGPIFKGHKVEGDKIRCYFDQAGGLKAPHGLKLFKIAGKDGIFVPAKAVIDSQTVVVSSPQVPTPVAVNYAWSDVAFGELFNKADLPASAFNTAWATKLDSRSNTLRPSPRKGWWGKRHQVKIKETQSGNVDLIFVGDSITHGWEGAGRSVWDKYYSKRQAINLGFSGDRTEHVLWRLDNGEVDGISPKVAVVMIGTNNTADYNPHTNSGQDTADGITAIVRSLRAKLPTTKVLVLSPFPSGEMPNQWRKRNKKAAQIVSKLADKKNIFYLSIYDQFLDENKKLSKDIMPDLLHPNTKGYQIWAEAMEPTLKKLLEE